VDNLVEGLAKVGVKPLRVGFSGNVRKSLLEHSLDYKLEQHPLYPVLIQTVEEEGELTAHLQELSKEYETLMLKLKQMTRPRKTTLARADNMKHALSTLAKRQEKLKRKIYAMQQDMLHDVVSEADVVSLHHWYSRLTELIFSYNRFAPPASLQLTRR